ncbi:site-specific integrase [Photobacterium sp. ZSDE20]|uniref:Site-specific integrase n=1 Tax=Photobacterium pectinilyticum TaxID=2906793 RepID=A0ABT1N5Q1_9GAMM|nr:site-specific integrase [Photobacterium sp. ZSDE20]MCQ1060065.1 site-specific integrase [Photobacterium sp. ZSDE20]MDD1827245.1 site-specific integrase [Photobacterium sp. ZSDE20]
MVNDFAQKSFFARESESTKIVSFNGFEFDYLDDVWVLNRNKKVSVWHLDKFKPLLRDDIRETLQYYAENQSAGYTEGHAVALNAYLKHSGADEFTQLGLVTFYNLAKNHDSKNNKFKEYVSSVRCFIRQMKFLGMDNNLDESIFELMDGWTIGGNDKGVPVLSNDAERGPFTDLEFDAIGHKAAHKYAEGVLSTEEYTVISMFKASGRRPQQVSDCKNKDFTWSDKFIGKPSYVGNMPRAKQRGGKFRSSFTPFGFTVEIGRLIEKHIKDQTLYVEKQLGRKLTNEQKGELPLFLDPKAVMEMKQLSSSSLLAYLKSELPHIKSRGMTGILKSGIEKLSVISERTGRPIHITGYRFRYTLGTRAAREGAGRLVLARLLDHSDDQHVDVYVANIPEFAVEISKIMNQSLARFASAFSGKVVRDEEEANTENAGAARIPCREMDCDVGSCGTSAFCQDYAPIACYLCPKFRPWAHAPHHLVLKWLVEERERLKVDAKGDMQIVTINDRAILAVCQVIEKCREYNND